MIEDFRLARGSVRNEAIIQNIENVLADLLELRLDLVSVFADGADVLVRSLRLLLLLDGGDDAPRGTASTDNILVGNREEVALVNAEFAAKLGDLLHVGYHLIVALGLLAEASEESLAIKVELLEQKPIGLRRLNGGEATTSRRAPKVRHIPLALYQKHRC